MSKIGNKISEDFIREAEKNDKKKKETIDVMKGTNKVEVNPKMQAEAKKMTKKQIKKRDEIADAISTREMNNRYGDKNVKYAIATKLAMKKEDVTLQDANGNDFVQIVDLIKPEPLVKARSVQEISECWKTHKQVGYKKKGGRMVPNCVPKNEEKEPTKGLMKLAATVAANNKKRKNALQIQKYIGEETPDAISGKDLKRISALSGKKTRFGDGPEGTAKRKAALEKKRGMKLDDHPQFKTEGKGSNPNKRYIGDPNVTSKKQFTKTGAIGVEITNPDEEQGIQQRRNAKEREREEKRKRIEQNKEKKRQQREGGNTDT